VPTADENCNSMPVLRRLSKVFHKRSGILHITPVHNDEAKDISSPTGFKHNCHVEFDNGKFVGLPPAWKQWLQNSNISYVCFVASACFTHCFWKCRPITISSLSSLLLIRPHGSKLPIT